PELDAIILECMEKDPNERTQSVKQIAIDLKRFKRESSRSRVSMVRPAMTQSSVGFREAQPILASAKSKFPWIVSLILFLVTITTLWAPWQSKREEPVARFKLTLPKDDGLDLIIYSALAIAPDGSRFVYRANGRLYLRTIDNIDAIAVPGTEDGGSPFFSPDGRWIGFFAGSKLKKVSISGGAPIVLADAPDNRGGSWGADGSIVFTPYVNSGLMRIPEAGGLVEPITTLDSTKRERTHRWPHFLPDGTGVMFTVGVTESPDYYEEATIQYVNLKTGARKLLINGASSAQYVETGHLIFSRSGVLYAEPFNANRIEVINSPSPVIDDVSGDPTTGGMHFSISRNGTLVYVSGNTEGTERALIKIDRNGKESTFDLTSVPIMEPRMSPDGKRIALVLGSGKDSDIWIYDVTRGTMSRLTFGGTNRTPTWSPDGKQVAYFSTSRGIFTKPFDGSANEKPTVSGLGRTYISAWSRDGLMLILDRATQGNQSDIHVLPLTETQKPFDFLSSEFDEYMGTLSPDQKWLAYVSNESGSYQVYVQSFPERKGKWQISTQGGLEPRWSPDGRTLYYHQNTRMMAVAISTNPAFSAGQPQLLFEGMPFLPTDSGVTYDVTPDGQYFISTRANKNDNFQQITVVLNWFTDLKSKISNIK
ncbi:PD40 domain-containing protein, partial [bacterium]|nr:PD40 domain-containing protein [bacterium]